MKNRIALVVGPSGVGKDSILDAARAALKDRSAIVFPRRVVTRAAGLGGEDYTAVSEAEFALMRARGDFALHWPAHGLHYGIPRSIDDDLAAGRQVVVNVSRAIVDEARRRYPGLLVIGITAAPETLRRRLEGRGRETADDIEQRLTRAAAFDLQGADTAMLSNDGALADSVARFIAILARQREETGHG